jgi:hypothetical protein
MKFQTIENFVCGCPGNLKLSAGPADVFRQVVLMCLVKSVDCASIYRRPSCALTMQDIAHSLKMFQPEKTALYSLTGKASDHIMSLYCIADFSS